MSAHPPLHVRCFLPLDRFDLDVELTATAQVTGIFGASGAGKTSLLRSIAGLKRRARGEIRLGDEIWLDSAARIYLPPEARDVGYVPQDGLLFPHKNVRQNLLAGAARARRNGRPQSATFDTVCRLLELEPLLRREVATLSGGERQRVALGRAICSGPRLMLLDEPLASLDLPLRRRLLPFLRRLRDELTVPMLLVSHDPIEVQALCDEIVVLREGAVVAHGEPRKVLSDPEIFSLAEREGYENVLPGRLVRGDDSTSLVRLGEGGAVEMVVPRGNRTGGEVLLSLPANEILLATEEPRLLSARNVMPGRVIEIRSLDHLGLVTVELGDGVPPLVVEVTEATPAALDLEPGGRVYLVIKATSCRIYGGEASTARSTRA